MAEPNSLRELRTKELTTLRDRVAKRIKIKPSGKRVRRIAGVDIMLTPQASKVHICACLLSFPKLEVLEEAIATDELDMVLYRQLGPLVFVPLVLSVLKMLKRKVDVIAVREPMLGEEIPLASYIGVISGRPAFGVSERVGGLRKMAKLDGVRRAGLLKLRGSKTGVSVVAGHLLSLKDASVLARACAKETRIPEPIRNAGVRVRSWEREWRRVNLERR
jgi:deoxyinosine 3'endonuclease (endonuclease V)